MLKSPALDPALIEAKIGSGYPAPFNASTSGRARRLLTKALGLSQFGVNITELDADTATSLGLASSHINSVSARGAREQQQEPPRAQQQREFPTALPSPIAADWIAASASLCVRVTGGFAGGFAAAVPSDRAPGIAPADARLLRARHHPQSSGPRRAWPA